MGGTFEMDWRTEVRPGPETRVRIAGGPVTIHRLWVDEEPREAITTEHADLFLLPGRSIVVEAEMTSKVTVEAVNGSVEIRVLEGARSQPREVTKHLVPDGGKHEVHIWAGHWVECKEVP